MRMKSGNEYVAVDLYGIRPGYPQSINSAWGDIPEGGIDAALYWTETKSQKLAFETGSLYLFKVNEFVTILFFCLRGS